MDKYQCAQDRIRDGLWSVDTDSGQVFNHLGKRLGCFGGGGYIVLTIRPEGIKGSRLAYAHRVIWESVNGEIPPELQVNHINGIKHDNRLVNLELVTPRENIQHAWRTGLASQPHGEGSRNARLTAVQVESIRDRYADGETQTAIAADLRISQAQISRIVHRKQWAA